MPQMLPMSWFLIMLYVSVVLISIQVLQHFDLPEDWWDSSYQMSQKQIPHPLSRKIHSSQEGYLNFA